MAEAHPGNVTLRTFREPDHRQVVDLWERAGLRVGESDTLEELKKVLAGDPGLFLVLEREGRIVGAVLGAWNGRRAWVCHLAVDPALQGHGLGQMLMEELEQRFRARGALKASLLVMANNRGAMEFYRHLGWEHQVDQLYFSKKL